MKNKAGELVRSGCALLLAGMAGATEARQVPALCQPGEQTYFSCTVAGKKTVSLCGSRTLGTSGSFLQYRFGRPGAVELRFPEPAQEFRQAFRYAHYLRFRVDRTAVSFRRNGYAYTIYDNYDGESGADLRELGVQVTADRAPGKSIDLRCKTGLINKLSSLQSVLRCDPNDPLNLGGCE